jgi:hypothetical protein
MLLKKSRRKAHRAWESRHMEAYGGERRGHRLKAPPLHQRRPSLLALDLTGCAGLLTSLPDACDSPRTSPAADSSPRISMDLCCLGDQVIVEGCNAPWTSPEVMEAVRAVQRTGRGVTELQRCDNSCEEGAPSHGRSRCGGTAALAGTP